MGQVASEVLAQHLGDEHPAVPAFEWKTYDMGLPLIDLEDKDALYRVLDEDD